VQQHGKPFQEINSSDGTMINDKNTFTLSLIMPGSLSFRRSLHDTSPRYKLDIIRKD